MNTDRTLNTEGAPSGARTGYVDREEQAFRELIEMRPLTHPNQEATARAAFGALLKTMRIDDILDEAMLIDEKPTDAALFLTNLASDKSGVTLGSS